MADSLRTENYASGRHMNFFLAYDDGPLSCDDIEYFILAGMEVGDSCLARFIANQFGNQIFRIEQLFPGLLRGRKL